VKKDKCHINIGLSGIIELMAKNMVVEYKYTGARIFKPERTSIAGSIIRLHLKPEDSYLVPWFIIAHESAHCVVEVCAGQRYSTTGRRQIHDETFVMAYIGMLHALSKYEPRIKKYLAV